MVCVCVWGGFDLRVFRGMVCWFVVLDLLWLWVFVALCDLRGGFVDLRFCLVF